jgi:hypothetical protein
MDGKERYECQLVGQRRDRLTYEWEKEKEMEKEREVIKAKKETLHIYGVAMFDAMRNFRLALCASMVGAIWYGFIYCTISGMPATRLHLTVGEYALIITGFTASQVLIVSMYREIKYGGYERGRWVN